MQIQAMMQKRNQCGEITNGMETRGPKLEKTSAKKKLVEVVTE